MKKIIFIFAFLGFLLLGTTFYMQRVGTKNPDPIAQPIKDSIAYFYEKIGQYASIPYKDAHVMFQWGYKKLTRKPIPPSELNEAKKAFLRTGVPVILVLTILAHFLYKQIPKWFLKKEEPSISPGKREVEEERPVEDVPVPDSC